MNIEKYQGKDACKFLKIRIEDGWVVVERKLPKCGDFHVSYNNNKIYEWTLVSESSSDHLPYCKIGRAHV